MLVFSFLLTRDLIVCQLQNSTLLCCFRLSWMSLYTDAGCLCCGAVVVASVVNAARVVAAVAVLRFFFFNFFFFSFG